MRFTQEQYLAVATFFLANPTLGIPVGQFQGDAGYTQDLGHDLDARSWWGNVGKGIKKALPVAAKVASKALPIAGKVLPIAAAILKREEMDELVARYPDVDWDESSLVARNLDDTNDSNDDSNEGQLSARDIDDLAELAARDPKFGGFLKKAAKGAIRAGKKAAPYVGPILSALVGRDELNDFDELSARDLEDLNDSNYGQLSARDVDDLNDSNYGQLSARDIDDLAELAARDPKFGGFLKKAAKGAIRAGKKAAPYVAPALLSALMGRDEPNEFDEISARDVDDFSEGQLSARDLDDLAELAARDPNFGGFLKKAAKGAIRAGKKAAPYVGPVLSALIARDELNDFSELSARDLDELAELAARDPSWGGIWQGVKNVGKEAIHVTHAAAPAIKEAIHLGQKVAPVVGPMLSKFAARDVNGWDSVQGAEQLEN